MLLSTRQTCLEDACEEVGGQPDAPHANRYVEQQRPNSSALEGARLPATGGGFSNKVPRRLTIVSQARRALWHVCLHDALQSTGYISHRP